MSRQPHYMKGNAGTEIPTNLIFVDTESNANPNRHPPKSVEHTLRLWVAKRVRLENGVASRTVQASGKTAAEFWTFVDRYSDAHRRTWIFAHNVGFDLTLLRFWHELDAGTFTLQPKYRKDKNGVPTLEHSWSGSLVIDHRVTFAKFRNGDKCYVAVDTLNYFPTKLWEVGRMFGMPKLDMPAFEASDDEWLRYCTRDVEIIELAITRLLATWRNEKCGVFKCTAASLAFTNWRHTCDVRSGKGDTLDVVCEPDSPQHIMERQAYYGGRIQPYYIGEIEGPIYHVDINSLYPYVMREHSFPRRYIRSEHGTSTDRLSAYARVYGIVASVRINSRVDTYPIRIDGRQYHCNGRFWTTLAGPELSRALYGGHVDRVGTVHIYSVAPLFRRWVDYWYGRKVAAGRGEDRDECEYEFAKLILNSLAGKFAQHGRQWDDVPGKVALQRWGGWCGRDATDDLGNERDSPGGSVLGHASDAMQAVWRRYRGIAGHVQVLREDREPNHAFPLISAYITSLAREYMHRVICHLPVRSAYYLAVDSLVVDVRGYRHLHRMGLIEPERLGAFRLVGKHSTGEIKGANYYELDGEVTVAGWEARSKVGANGGKVCEVWERLPSIIANGPRSTVTVRTVPIGEYAPDRKGCIGKDGWWTPFRLSLDPDFTDKPPKREYTLDDLDRMTRDSLK